MALVVYRFLTRARPVEPVAAAAAAAEDVTAGDPDERIEALRRKLEAARETSARETPAPASEPAAFAAPAEPPLDERRRAVHDAGRSAADAMRQAGERPGRPEQPGPADPTGTADPAG